MKDEELEDAIMKKIIRFLGNLVIVLLLSVSFGTVNKAAAETISYDEFTPTRSVNYEQNMLYYTVDDTSYSFKFDYPIVVARCSEDGALWIECNETLYFISYEIEGADISAYKYYSRNKLALNITDSIYVSEFIWTEYNYTYRLPMNHTGGELEEIMLTTPFDEILYQFSAPTSGSGITAPTSAPSNAPSVAPSAAPTVDPSDAPSVVPSTAPTVASSNTPSVAPSTVPTVAPDETQAPDEAAAPTKVTVSGNKMKLVDSKGNVCQTATFNKKKATLNFNGVKLQSVKAACFTKKGTLVYLKKNGKAYYMVGKKSKLIAKNVSSMKKDSKGFAVKLVTKKGKKITLSW